jgi:VanZ family protein
VKLRALWLAIGWGLVATIIWLSLTPRPPDIGIEHGDKLGHFGAYGVAIFWFCQIYPRRRTRVAYAAGFIAMGIALEFVQRATGYRTFEVLDMVADAIGVALGLAAAHAAPRLLK